MSTGDKKTQKPPVFSGAIFTKDEASLPTRGRKDGTTEEEAQIQYSTVVGRTTRQGSSSEDGEAQAAVKPTDRKSRQDRSRDKDKTSDRSRDKDKTSDRSRNKDTTPGGLRDKPAEPKEPVRIIG